MANNKVIAYGMHERELDDIRAAIKNPTATESFIIGEMSDSDIHTLQSKGIIIEITPKVEIAHTPGTLPHSEHRPKKKTKSGFFQSLKKAIFGAGPVSTTSDKGSFGWTKSLGPAPKNMPAFDPGQQNPYLITLGGPLLEQWRQHLKMINIELLEYIPENSYTTRLTVNQLNEARKLNFVVDVRSYQAEDTHVLDYLQLKNTTKSLGDLTVFDVRLHTPQDQNTVLTWLNTQNSDQNVEILEASGRKIRIKIPFGSAIADDIVFLPAVAEIQEYVEPKLFNNHARQLIGLEENRLAGAAHFSQTGEGEIVAVADTGLDDTHPDFPAARLVKLIARGRVNDASDPNGHGTHVAGSILGDGTASNGELVGTAPAAKLVFQSIMDARGRLGGLPINLYELFEEAYQLGARIHNNSWGSETESLYTFNSIEVDEFVENRRDMLLVIAAGNEGVANDRRHSAKGFVDWLSLGSPATAKNALTVGASRNDRTEGGYSTKSYGAIWHRDFPDPPISTDPVSGNPEAIAGFSSRGPCDDRRIKPELVAPGTDILSARSATAPDRHYWGLYEDNSKYAYMGGTSMATPLVSGCAALVREYYAKDLGINPSAALLKATLVNSTVRLTDDTAVAGHDKVPNIHQGFGRINMTNAIPNSGNPDMQLIFIDSWQDQQQQLSRTGQRLRYFFRLSGRKDLRICIAWSDTAGRGVQNSIGLFLEHQATREKWLGNADRPNKLTPVDRDNNVQIIRIENPPEGDYVIQVFARNLLKPPQDFALVIFGELGGTQLTRI